MSDSYKAEMRLGHDHINLMQSLEVELILTFPKDYQVDVEQLKSNLLQHSAIQPAPFSLVSVKEEPKEAFGQKFLFVLQPQITGEFPITFRNIAFVSAGKKEEIVSDLYTVTVEEQSVKEASSIEIGPILPLSPSLPISLNAENQQFTEKRFSQEEKHVQQVFAEAAFPWLELIVGGLALVFIALSIKTHESIKPESKEKRIERARKQAMALIDELKKRPHVDKEQMEAFYSDLTEAIRHFIEEKYQIRAPTLTTPEFLQEMAQHPAFGTEERNRFAQFLESADRVKFAGYQPSEKEYFDALNTAQMYLII